MNKFQIFMLNFSWDMSKMHYFSNKFEKIVKRWGLSASSAPYPSILGPEVLWLAQIVFFQTD